MESFSTKCPTCSAKIPFDPKSQLWVCDYCGGRFTAEQIKSFEQNNKDVEEEKQEYTHNYDVEVKEETSSQEDSSQETNDEFDMYTCENCGAQLVADKNTTATFCVYCGGYSLIKERLVGKFKPQFIIPFQTTKEEAKEQFLKYVRSRTFTPKKFRSLDNVEKITGVYIPFWTYDSKIDVAKSGTGTKVRVWRASNYEYTETSEYRFNREVINEFDDVPVDGSKKFDDDLMDSIEQFDYAKKKEFDSRYLSGFLAEKYDVDKEEAYARALLRMVNTTNKTIDNTISYTIKVVDKHTTSEQRGEVCYWLLPVWMLNTKYNDKMYEFAMNGESKKMVGNFPISFKKIIAMVASLFAIIFALAYVGETLMTWLQETHRGLFSGYFCLYIVFLIVLLVVFYTTLWLNQISK